MEGTNISVTVTVFLSPCCVGINNCNVIPFLSRILSFQNIICQGAEKVCYLKGLDAKQIFAQKNGLPSAVVTRHPLGLGKSVQSQPGLISRKAHLQVQMPQGRSLASASDSGQAIDLCFDRRPL